LEQKKRGRRTRPAIHTIESFLEKALDFAAAPVAGSGWPPRRAAFRSALPLLVLFPPARLLFKALTPPGILLADGFAVCSAWIGRAVLTRVRAAALSLDILRVGGGHKSEAQKSASNNKEGSEDHFNVRRGSL
jgi:hypothetical protein